MCTMQLCVLCFYVSRVLVQHVMMMENLLSCNESYGNKLPLVMSFYMVVNCVYSWHITLLKHFNLCDLFHFIKVPFHVTPWHIAWLQNFLSWTCCIEFFLHATTHNLKLSFIMKKGKFLKELACNTLHLLQLYISRTQHTTPISCSIQCIKEITFFKGGTERQEWEVHLNFFWPRHIKSI